MNLSLSTEAEIAALKELCASIDVPVELASVWADGAEGGVSLAETLVKTIDENPANYTRLYENELSVQEKSKRLLLKFTVVARLTLRRKLKHKSLKSFKTDGTNCQSVWLKLSTVSQTIQMHLEHQKTLKLPFVNWYQN